MFLKLTERYTGEKITVNISQIVYYEPRIEPDQNSDNYVRVGSFLTTTQDIKSLKETPEEIDRLLLSSYVTIKEVYENRTSKVPQYPTNSQLDDSEQLQSGSCGSSCEHCSCL
jgi:hypothetical protein